MNMMRNGESTSIASPTTISLFFNVLGFDTKSLLTQKFLQRMCWNEKTIIGIGIVRLTYNHTNYFNQISIIYTDSHEIHLEDKISVVNRRSQKIRFVQITLCCSAI